MEKLLAILEELRPDVDFTAETHLIDDGILDSIDIVSIIAEIEDAFGVKITAQYIRPEHFNSAQALHQMILRLSEDV